MSDAIGAARAVRVQVPATTTNLGPGFDCLGMALTLYNEVALETAREGLEIQAEGEGVDRLPRDQSNLVCRAIEHVYRKANMRLPGLRIQLKNAIPVERGLGSSAAALVGGLVGANRLLGEPFLRETLMAWAADWEGHPDNVVPAFVGGWTIACRESTALHYLRLDPPEGLWAVAAAPVEETSTRAARQVLPDRVPFADALFNVGRTGLLVAALASGRYDLLGPATEDRLHQPYRRALNPGMESAIHAARLAGAPGACLSGSGSTVLALTPHSPEKIALAMQESFRSRGIDCRTWVLSPSKEGASVLPDLLGQESR